MFKGDPGGKSQIARKFASRRNWAVYQGTWASCGGAKHGRNRGGEGKQRVDTGRKYLEIMMAVDCWY